MFFYENGCFAPLQLFAPCTLSEFRILRGSWERNDIANVLHAGDEEDESFEAEPESSVGACAILAGVEIPPHILHGDVAALDFAKKFVVAFFTNRASDDFADLREEHVGALHGLLHRLAVELGELVVDLHVEGFDLLGIVGHDDRFLEVFLDQIAFVLAGEVVAPLARELELASVADGLLQDTYALGVVESDEFGFDNTLQPVDERAVDHLVEEGKVVGAIVERPLHAILDEVFLEVHELGKVDEGHFRFNHPELGQMARCVGVLGTEGGAEGVDGSECRCTEFAFELSRDGERGHLPEEVVVVDDVSFLVFLQTVEVLSGDLEHLPCSLGIAGSDEGSVEIEESVVVEILVDGDGHVVADAHDGTKGIGTQAQVCALAHDLEGLSLLLHGIVGGAKSKDVDVLTLHFAGLTSALALDKNTACCDAGTGGDVAKGCAVHWAVGGYHQLDVVDGGAVVEGDEVHRLAGAMGANPSFDKNLVAKVGGLESINYFCSLHIIK